MQKNEEEEEEEATNLVIKHVMKEVLKEKNYGIDTKNKYILKT